MKIATIGKFFTTAAAVLVAANAYAATIDCLIISEVVDATRAGGNPKYVEITNTGTTPYTFTNGGVIVQSNAAVDLLVDVDLTGVTIPALDSYVIQSDANDGINIFQNTYGFAADLYTPAFFSNGDDRYILASGDDTPGAGGTAALGDLLDIHGQNGVDGTGLSWEYLDGYAFRLPAANMGNDGNFVQAEWFQSGNGALESGVAGGDAGDLALILAQTTPGTHVFVPCIPEPSSLALMLLAGLATVGIRRRTIR